MLNHGINISDIPSAGSNLGGIDMIGRVGNFPLQVRETIGRRESQEDKIFHITTPADTKDAAEKLLRDAFTSADERTHYNKEGSCGTAAIISKDRYVTVAHLGDSPVVLFVVGADKKVTARPLIKMHKPSDPDEWRRIEKAGGFVEWGRVDGRLAISRAFGDADYGEKVSKTPDITQINLADYVKPGEKAYLCVSCDGLYEGNIPENDFAEIIRQALEKGETRIANKLKDYAIQQRSGDNISVILAEIPDTIMHSVALGVCDGHGGDLTSKQAAAALEETIGIGHAIAPRAPAKPLQATAPLPYPGNWYTGLDSAGKFGGNKNDGYWYIDLEELPPGAQGEIEAFLKTIGAQHTIQPGAQATLPIHGAENTRL